jgi:chromosome partitioning protein
MIVLICSQKGGAGKSTIAVNVSVEYAKRGHDVVLVDADPQQSASRWHADREDAQLVPEIAGIQKLGNLCKTLKDLDRRYGVVVVDVAGHDSTELRTAMTAAHLMVLTMRPSQLDLDTTPQMCELIEQARDFNPELVARGLLTQVPTNVYGYELAEATDYLSDYQTLVPLRTVIYERKVYRDVIGQGRAVVESSNPLARKEIQDLVEELIAS